MKILKLDTSLSKTYATEANAIKAAEAKFGHTDLRCMVLTNDQGRFFPVFIGQDATTYGAHFHFHVVC